MKKHIILILKTLINNNACVEAARTREKKYNIIPVIFAIVALFLSCLPICVTGFQQQGQNWVSVTNNIDDGLYNFGELMDTKQNVTLKIQEDKDKHHYVDINLDELKTNSVITQAYDYPTTTTHPLTNLYRFTYIADQSTEKGKTFILEIYFYDGNVKDAKENKDVSFAQFVQYIALNQNPYKTDEHLRVKREEGDKTTNLSRNNPFMVFSKDQIYCYNTNLVASTSGSTLLGDYNNTKVGTDILHDFFDKQGFQEGTLNKWKVFFNESYINNRFNNTWRSTYIVLGINGGVLIFMGFMVWILTRGKNNPFRIYSFWDGQKIAYYACLTPGILSLIGFVSSSLAMMLFVLCCGVRVMWLSMRTLKYTAPQK